MNIAPFRSIPLPIIRIIECVIYLWAAIELMAFMIPGFTSDISSVDLITARSLVVILFFVDYYLCPEEDIRAGQELIDQIANDKNLNRVTLFRIALDLLTAFLIGAAFYRLWVSAIAPYPFISVVIFVGLYLCIQLKYPHPLQRENL